MNKRIIALLTVGLLVPAGVLLTRSWLTPPIRQSASPPPEESAPLAATEPEVSLPSQRLAAESHATIPAPENPAPTNLYARLVAGDVPKLSPEQLETYLKQNQRSVESLLAAFRANSDTTYLKEAEEKFPNDPRVAYAALFKSDTPEERSQWLERLKQVAPDNALGNYFSALDAFKSGQTSLAVQEMTAATGKQFQDYTMDFLQNGEEAYKSAGYSDADAKQIAATQLLLPDLSELRQLGREMVSLANSYRQSGDTVLADATLQTDIALGRRFGGYPGEPLIDQLVGIAIERDALTTMDPNSSFGESGQTVQDRLNQLNTLKQSLKTLAQQETGLFAKMSDSDVVSYWDRWRTFGYQPTMQWAITKYGQ
jgi:hypothetical protein